MDACRRIRSFNNDVPVLMLTALDSMHTKVEGLDAGADDYIVKPFHLVELLARVRALLRRSPRAHAPVLQAQGVSRDPASRTALRAGRTIELTAKEFAVLEYLMRNAGTIISATELIDHAWDSNYEGFSNVVQTYIRYLRQKLTLPGETEIVETRRGAGTDLKRTYQVVDLNELIRLDIDARASNSVEAARLDIHRGQATVVLGSPALLARAIANII